MENKLVTTIIPAYNGEKYLDDAISSVLNQTEKNFEIVVVDDGSSDATRSIVEKYGSRVRYFYQKNRGTASARNHGIHFAAGHFFAFLDQDDLWLANKLAVQLEAFRADPKLDFVFGQVEQFYSPDIDDDLRNKIHNPSVPVPGILASAMLVKREAFFQVGFFETKWKIGEWSSWYIRAVDLGLNMTVLSDLVAKRRIHSGNKGILHRNALNEYAQILKKSIDRRRANQIGTG